MFATMDGSLQMSINLVPDISAKTMGTKSNGPQVSFGFWPTTKLTQIVGGKLLLRMLLFLFLARSVVHNR